MAGKLGGLAKAAGYIVDEVGDAVMPYVDDAISAVEDFARGPRGPSREIDRIPSRLPGTKSPIDDPLDRTLTIDREAAVRAPEVYEHNVRRLTDIPGLGHLSDAADVAEIEGEAMKHFEDNLQFLIDITPAGKVARNREWYVGANNFAHTLADRYGLDHRSVAGTIAALSPQKDWYQNASLAERMADINFQKSDVVTSNDMLDFGMNNLKKQEQIDVLSDIAGKRLSDLDTDLERAVWIRLYDEVHNPKHYREFTPDGMLGDFVKKGDGTDRKVSWGSFNEIIKADKALRSGGDLDTLSNLMGTKHKVRSFFNNNADPFSPYDDVTGDTHQVAGNTLMPYSGNSGPVQQNFGTASFGTAGKPDNWVPAKSANPLGVHGTYPFHADAVRNVARRNNLMGREGQSVTWETIREMFPAADKNPEFMNRVANIWRSVERGEINAGEARNRIARIARRPSPLGEGGRGVELLDPKEASTY